jgi:hypothetical protein
MARALTAQQREEWMAAMEARTAAAHAQLVEGVTRLAGREGWQEWLGFAARLPHYSVSNQLLLAAQAPNASLVMSAAQWRQVGRYPARGSTALRIWAPRRAAEPERRAPEDRSAQEPEQRNDTRTPVARDAEGRARFLLVPVFDVAQTDGEPLPQQPAPVPPPPGQAPDGMWDALVGYATEAGFAVAFGETGRADGTTNFSTRRITIAERGSELSRTLTLAHEIGHMSLHAVPEARQYGQAHRGRAEVEAESVAYLVAADYGLAEAYDWHFDYLSHWSAALTGGTTDADATREAIRATASRVMTAARPVLTHLRELSVGHPEPLAPAPAPKPAPVVAATVTR